MIAFLVVAGLVTGCKPSFAQVAHADAVVVLELFTSQGCSSCPPADRVLTAIGQDKARKGKVIALAYHVDYWDYIGWKDPFASELWSNRQRDYGQRAFDTRRIYTPQLVINGRSHLVGSNRSGVDDGIAKATATPAQASVTATTRTTQKGLKVSGTATLEKASESPVQVVVVVYENNITTRVTRGENTGRTLRNDHIVRRLVGAVKLSGQAGEPVAFDETIALDPAWKAENIGAVILVQDPKTMAILGAAAP